MVLKDRMWSATYKYLVCYAILPDKMPTIFKCLKLLHGDLQSCSQNNVRGIQCSNTSITLPSMLSPIFHPLARHNMIYFTLLVTKFIS